MARRTGRPPGDAKDERLRSGCDCLSVLIRCSSCGTDKPRSGFYDPSHDRSCIGCKRESSRAYYRAHREKKIAYAKAYATANRERMREWQREYARRNQPKNAANTRAWREENRDQAREQVRRRRASMRGPYSHAEMAKLISQRFAVFGNVCAECGSKDSIEADHVKPLSRGGPHIPANIRPLCRSCNGRKAGNWNGIPRRNALGGLRATGDGRI